MDKRTILFVFLMAASFYIIQLIIPKPKQPDIVQTEQQVPEKKEDITPPTIKKKFSFDQFQEERFYVLENDFQMLVFSTKGGSIAEINLPFKSKNNKESIVNSIEIDKELKLISPKNASFPLHPYFVFEDGKINKKNSTTLSGYYPLIRRDLIGDEKEVNPKFYSLNIVSDYEEIENANFKMTDMGKDYITFEYADANRKISKTYQFAKEAPYTFDMTLSIEGDTKNLWLTTGVPEVEHTSGRSDPTLKIRTFRKQKSVVEKLKLPKDTTTISAVFPDWICNSNGFFGIIIDPLNELAPGYRTKYIAGTTLATRLTLIDAQYNLYPAAKYPGYEMFLPLRSIGKKTTFRVVAGPFAKDTLKAIDATYSNAITGYNPDYVDAKSIHGFFAFVSEPFAKLMFLVMQLFYKITHSWGFSIILLTLVLRLMLYPLNAWSIKSNLKMQKLAPQIEEIKKKWEKDPQRQKLEMMKIYRQKGANPLMGCFPIFIQLPFLIGMFDLLKTTFELRGVPFVPGWITSLTSPDVLFSWGYPIPLLGTDFHLLPIIVGITMYLQSKFMTKKPDKSKMTDQQKQQQMLTTIMPIAFTVLFYKMPSGLNLYFLFSMLFGVIQQIYTNKMMEKNKN
ncbi:MAG: membrane protein insertase YidC [Parachlamydiales bacterium]|nr:membrane protein insertase YidC [Parachlamydiales bacterium]